MEGRLGNYRRKRKKESCDAAVGAASSASAGDDGAANKEEEEGEKAEQNWHRKKVPKKHTQTDQLFARFFSEELELRVKATLLFFFFPPSDGVHSAR